MQGSFGDYTFLLPQCERCKAPVEQTIILEYRERNASPHDSNSYDVQVRCHGEVGARWFKNKAAFVDACRHDTSPALAPLHRFFRMPPKDGFGSQQLHPGPIKAAVLYDKKTANRPWCMRCQAAVANGLIIAEPVSHKALTIYGYCHGDMEVGSISYEMAANYNFDDGLPMLDMFGAPLTHGLRVLAGTSVMRSGHQIMLHDAELQPLEQVITQMGRLKYPAHLHLAHHGTGNLPPHKTFKEWTFPKESIEKGPKVDPPKITGTVKFGKVNVEAVKAALGVKLETFPLLEEVQVDFKPPLHPMCKSDPMPLEPKGGKVESKPLLFMQPAPDFKVPDWLHPKKPKRVKTKRCKWCDAFIEKADATVVLKGEGLYHLACYHAFDDRARRGKPPETPADLRKRKIALE